MQKVMYFMGASCIIDKNIMAPTVLQNIIERNRYYETGWSTNL